MRVAPLIRAFAYAMELLVLGASVAYAQSEIDPDHFDSPNTEPFAQPKLTPNSQSGETRYDGKFTLPYTVQCSGKSLPPGKYSFSFRSDGKVGQGVMKSKDQTVEIVGTVHRQARKAGRDALIVENQRSTRMLAVIQVAELDLVLDAKREMNHASSNKPGRIESLPVMVVRKDSRTTGNP
jgi:hypothetical protein